MTPQTQIRRITSWIRRYARQSQAQCLVVGISGGIDSSVVSTLCAHTGLAVRAVIMPIRQSQHTHDLSLAHGEWLLENFTNVRVQVLNLDPAFDQFERLLIEQSLITNGDIGSAQEELAFANSRSRLRMMSLYQIAQANQGLVVGTGNRVEDFGVGFFTKYGDGGVDISPIGDCVKTQVWAMGRQLGILSPIIEAAPTDGLWPDGRTDEDQIGMTYPELEEAMRVDESGQPPRTPQQRQHLRRYRQIRRRNLHKMMPIPVCKMTK